jgi:hypothetical protein
MENEKIDSLVQRAVVADLDGLDFLSSYDYKEISAAYNGIGPEWMPADLREKVSAYLDLFAPAALIHDMRYQVSDGSRFNFNYANLEFYGNCVKLANDAYPWWNWRRYGARIAAAALYDFVRSQGGWVAWSEAARKNLH